MSSLPQDVFSADASVAKFLFHYTSASSLGKILESMTLRLGRLSSMNDPREAEEWRVNILEVGSAPRSEVECLAAEVAAILRNRARLASFTLDRTALKGAEQHLFHRGWARARMWAQYADNHAGACIVLDKEGWSSGLSEVAEEIVRSEFEVDTEVGPLTVTGPIQYRDTPIDKSGSLTFKYGDLLATNPRLVIDHHIRIAVVTGRPLGVLDDLMFTKNTDWQSENELRSVLYTNHPDEISVDIKSAIRAIVVGGQFPALSIPGIRTFLDAAGLNRVPVVRCVWSNGAPKVETLSSAS